MADSLGMVIESQHTHAFPVTALVWLMGSFAMNGMLSCFIAPCTHAEYSPVSLLKNRSAVEIGRFGQYLLSITSSAIVLHWKTGAIAHHWPTKNVLRLYHPGKEGHLLLIVKR